jgi:hypothetical protein
VSHPLSHHPSAEAVDRRPTLMRGSTVARGRVG